MISSSIKTLILNKAYLPINVIPWDKVMTLWSIDKITVIDTYPEHVIRTGVNSITGKQLVMNCPSIVYLHKSTIHQHALVRTIPFSRENIFHRDEGKCIYCKRDLTLSNFTIEHVTPTSKGGLNDWYNCRVSCSSCNQIKGDKTLEELGWENPSEALIPILNKKVPKNLIKELRGKIPVESWRSYIYWDFDNINLGRNK